MNDPGMDVGPLVAAPPQGAGLTPEQAVAWCRALTGADGQEVIEQVRAWLAAGLPADPPAELGSLVDDRLAPSTVAAWLAAGFDLPAVARLAGIPLEAALSWRAAGLSTEQIRAVVD